MKSPVIDCLNIFISELVLPVYVLPFASCNLSTNTFVMCKIKGYVRTYVLTYLLMHIGSFVVIFVNFVYTSLVVKMVWYGMV